MNDNKSGEHSMVDESTDGAALNIIRQKTVKRPKPFKIALQILQQDTKNDKIRYFMRWENRNAQSSWSWAIDITEDLKRIFYNTHTLDGAPRKPWSTPRNHLQQLYNVVPTYMN